MHHDQFLAEIREANLSYLMLAQSLVRADREQALYRLGISDATAVLLARLTPAQMVKIARSNTLVCRLRVDEVVLGLEAGPATAANTSDGRLHASIVMAGRHREAA